MRKTQGFFYHIKCIFALFAFSSLLFIALSTHLYTGKTFIQWSFPE